MRERPHSISIGCLPIASLHPLNHKTIIPEFLSTVGIAFDFYAESGPYFFHPRAIQVNRNGPSSCRIRIEGCSGETSLELPLLSQ